MTRRLAPRLRLHDTISDKIGLRCTHAKHCIITGVFLAPTYVASADGAFVVFDKFAKLVVLRTLDASETFSIVGEGRMQVDAMGSSEAHWYAVDTSRLTKDSMLAGYDGFCFIGDANAVVDLENGFIPFGETEVMLDADGRKFLVVGSE